MTWTKKNLRDLKISIKHGRVITEIYRTQVTRAALKRLDRGAYLALVDYMGFCDWADHHLTDRDHDFWCDVYDGHATEFYGSAFREMQRYLLGPRPRRWFSMGEV